MSDGGRERRIRREERTQRSEASSAMCCAVAETPGLVAALAGAREVRGDRIRSVGEEKREWGARHNYNAQKQTGTMMSPSLCKIGT